MFQGIGIFDFSLSGVVYKISEVSDAIGKCQDKIIIVKNATPDIVLLFNEIKAVLCENGGRTCHLAILAREMSIPCILGVSGISKIENDTKIKIESIDGRGIVSEAY